MSKVFESELPERARRNKVLMEAERIRRAAAARNITVEQLEEERRAAKSRSLWTKLTGDAETREERARKEKEARVWQRHLGFDHRPAMGGCEPRRREEQGKRRKEDRVEDGW